MLTADGDPVYHDHNTARRERASSAVEYVGLAALSMMVVSGIASALDGAAGARIGEAIISRLLAAVTG